MLAKGTGCRQFATRRALYCDANEAISADEVPGTPLASTAPGAPAVEPPIAAGHVGVGVGVGVGTEVTAAGVVVNVRPETLTLVDVAETEVAWTAVLELVVGLAAAVAVAVAVAVLDDDVAAVVPPVDAGAVLTPRSPESASEEPLGALEPATIAPLVRAATVVTDGPAP